MSTYHGRTLAVLTASLSFASFILLLPLIYLKRKNLALVTLIASICITALMQFLNAIIWSDPEGPSHYMGQGLCDIEVKLSVGFAVTVPGAILCIYRQIALVTDPTTFGIQPSLAQKRWNKLFEIGFCIALPLLRMLAVYFVQPNRYSIVGVTGCVATIDPSWPKYPLVVIWPVLLGCITMVWAAIATWHLVKHLNEIIELLGNSQIAKAKKTKLIKIYVLTSALFLIITPLNVYLLWNNIYVDTKTGFLQPYSWVRIHSSNWATKTIQSSLSTSDSIPLFGRTTFCVVTAVAFTIGQDCKVFYTNIWNRLRITRSGNRNTIQKESSDFHTPSTFVDIQIEHNEHPVLELPPW